MGKTMIYVPKEAGEEISIYNGEETKTYKVSDGSLSVDDSHVGDVLASVPGARLTKSEAPMLDKSSLGIPAKTKEK